LFKRLQPFDQAALWLNTYDMIGTSGECFGSGNPNIGSRVENYISGSHTSSEQLAIDVGLRIAKLEQEPEGIAPFMREPEIES
jgi:hypothetical protein